MPELPEVAYFQEYLDRTALNHRIDNVQAVHASALNNTSPTALEQRLCGHTFTGTHRHGKYLFLHLDDENWLCLHFGLTGDLDYYRDDGETPPNTQLLVEFDNDHQLAYTCRRPLGMVELTDNPDHFADRHQIGPDVLSLNEFQFRALADAQTSNVKSWLTDQSVMAGIGSLYADEILYQGRIHPASKVDQLSAWELARLHNKVHFVLNAAIEAHADIDAMPSDWLIHRRRSGAYCAHCENPVKKTTVSGRITFYCGHCQPRPAAH